MNAIRVIPFGTSSGVPTRERNVSSVAVALDGRWLLLDCGEGTQHRLLRSRLKPSQLEAVFVTHLHGDHVYGLPGLLSTMSMQNREEPLAVHGPEGIRAFVEDVIRATDLRLSYPLRVSEVSEGLVARGQGYSVECRALDHRALDFGYAVIEDARSGKLDLHALRARGLVGVLPGPDYGKLKAGADVRLADGRVIRSREVLQEPRMGRRIAYCTDTRPCLGAIELARDAGAKRLLLTHFSPRYRDPSVLVAEAGAIFPNCEAAEDLNEIRVA